MSVYGRMALAFVTKWYSVSDAWDISPGNLFMFLLEINYWEPLNTESQYIEIEAIILVCGNYFRTLFDFYINDAINVLRIQILIFQLVKCNH